MRIRPICSFPGCGKPHSHRGFCATHAYRWLSGSPPMEAPESTKKGAPMEFLAYAASYAGDECLTWPFATTNGGRPSIRGENACRVVCKMAHGEPPTPKHQAAHSCGKGHEGCVNGKHLRWATVKENMADKYIHNTMVRGDRIHTAVLNEDDVRAIRVAHQYMQITQLARWYGVNRKTIYGVVNGTYWGWVE